MSAQSAKNLPRPSMRAARPEDGKQLYELVRNAGTLELNTAYFYLIFAEHFGQTCLIAEEDGKALGGVVAYRPPTHTDTVFVWQIGVAPEARGRGLARAMLNALVELPGCKGVRYLEASVTGSNTASRALFTSFARHADAELTISDFFTTDRFPGEHEAEDLFRIGPLPAGQNS